MDHTLQISQFNMGHVTEILAQILQLYKTAGPQSMETLAQSYLAEAPTAESAADAAEGLMAQAFAQFDHAADAVLRGFAGQQGFDLNDSKNYRRRLEEGYFQVAYPFVVMYMIWLDREGQQRAIEKMDIFFQSVMLGVAGYMILDSNLDEL